MPLTIQKSIFHIFFQPIVYYCCNVCSDEKFANCLQKEKQLSLQRGRKLAATTRNVTVKILKITQEIKEYTIIETKKKTIESRVEIYKNKQDTLKYTQRWKLRGK